MPEYRGTSVAFVGDASEREEKRNSMAFVLENQWLTTTIEAQSPQPAIGGP